MWSTLLRYKGHTDVVQGIEDTEDIQTVLNGLLREVIDGIVAAKASSQPPRLATPSTPLTGNSCTQLH